MSITVVLSQDVFSECHFYSRIICSRSKGWTTFVAFWLIIDVAASLTRYGLYLQIRFSLTFPVQIWNISFRSGLLREAIDSNSCFLRKLITSLSSKNKWDIETHEKNFLQCCIYQFLYGSLWGRSFIDAKKHLL